MDRVAEAKAAIWKFIANAESGVLSLDPKDSGNWTSGIPGIGQLKGSKWGVSAAAFPNVDIANVTFDNAMALCFEHYWPAINGDWLVAQNGLSLAMLMLDAAWNNGPAGAIKILQTAISMSVVDGIFGPDTERRVISRFGQLDGVEDLCSSFSAWRIIIDSNLKNWDYDKKGWVQRVVQCFNLALHYLPSEPSPLTS